MSHSPQPLLLLIFSPLQDIVFVKYVTFTVLKSVPNDQLMPSNGTIHVVGVKRENSRLSDAGTDRVLV